MMVLEIHGLKSFLSAMKEREQKDENKERNTGFPLFIQGFCSQ